MGAGGGNGADAADLSMSRYLVERADGGAATRGGRSPRGWCSMTEEMRDRIARINDRMSTGSPEQDSSS